MEGDAIRFTRSKYGKTLYAIANKWPGPMLTLASVKPAEGSQVTMLGDGKPLKWSYAEGTVLKIELPAALPYASANPLGFGYAFKIEVK